MHRTLPSFIGIGVPRAGTTWLHEMLSSSHDVYVPARRKEINYFDKYYERGQQWYSGFFPEELEASQYRTIGEITPHYFFCESCPERIASLPSVQKLILMLRHPVDRAYSYYRHIAPIDDYRGSFEGFLDDYPEVVQEGFYSQCLENYLGFFRREQLLVLVYEEVFDSIEASKQRIASFLNVKECDANEFDRVVNRSYRPKYQRAYSLAARLDRQLRRRDLDWLVNAALSLGAKRLFGKRGSFTPMKDETRCHLRELYNDDVARLESILHRRVDCWRR